MVERPWNLPDTDTLGRAMVLAEVMSSRNGQDAIVCAVVIDGELGFNIHTPDSYAALREAGNASHLAPICAVHPSGATRAYEVMEGFIPPYIPAPIQPTRRS